MARRPGVEVTLKSSHEIAYFVKLHHYEHLKRSIDEREMGWVELESIHGDGRFFVELADIRTLFLMTESYCEERNEADRQDKLTES